MCLCILYLCIYMYIYIHMYQETWTQGCDGWCRQLHNQLAGAMPMPNFTTQWQSNFASPSAALGCLLWMGKKNAPPKMDWFHGSRIATYCFGCIDLPHFSNCGMSWRSIIEPCAHPWMLITTTTTDGMRSGSSGFQSWVWVRLSF